MKNDIHPTYNENVVVKCACGASFTVGSTRDNLGVEVCSQCHPFFTGKQKLLDTAGRVDRFKARLETSNKLKEELAKKKAAKKIKVEKQAQEDKEAQEAKDAK